MAELKPIVTVSLVDKVETSLKEFIRENQLKPGDTLPKEIEIAESLNVSRTVVREALLRLRTIGIIDSRKHKGMTITHPDIVDGIEQMLDPVFLSEDTLNDIFELRLILELGMGEMIYRRKSEEDLEELKKIVENEHKSDRDASEFTLEYEVAFHGKLYEMSGNTTLQRFQRLLLPIFQFVNEKGNRSGANGHSGPEITHRDLYSTLKDGTPDDFRIAMRQHLEPHFNNIFDKERI